MFFLSLNPIFFFLGGSPDDTMGEGESLGILEHEIPIREV